MQNLDSPAQPGRFLHWMCIFTVFASVVALSLDFVFATTEILSTPAFLRGFGVFMVQVMLASAVGGGIGAILAELALRNWWITDSAIRFLRVGMWLPLFGAWAAPMWGIGWSKALFLPDWADPVLRVVIPIVPTTLFAACYYQLTARYTLQLDTRSAVAPVIRSVVLHALFFAFLAQLYFQTDGWHWFPQSGHGWWARAAATTLLLGGFLLVLVWSSSSRFEKTSKMKGLGAFRQIRASNWKSFLGAGMLWILCFAVWDAFYPFLRDVFMIAPARQVMRAIYRLLTSGSMMANRESMLWWDIAVSAQEIGEGLLLAGILAFILVRVVESVYSGVRLSWIFALTHILPIVIAVRLIAWFGVGHWLKAVIIAAACFFAFAETLWGLRTAPRLTRLLIALDNALPYAFIGMLFGEAWGAIEGVGFFIILARADGNRTEALAASLIALGLMVFVSLLLRLVLKRLNTSEPEIGIMLVDNLG